MFLSIFFIFIWNLLCPQISFAGQSSSIFLHAYADVLNLERNTGPHFPNQDLEIHLDQESDVIQVSGFRNNCFFNAIRHFGIDISRESLVELLRDNLWNRTWRRAIMAVAIPELTEANQIPEFLQTTRDYLLQYPSDFELDRNTETQIYQWFISYIAGDNPIPFINSEQNALDQDFLELTGQRFGFDLRIVQERTNHTNSLQVIRFFHREENENRRRITLLYHSGQTGHFDIIQNPQESLAFQNASIGGLYHSIIQVGEGNQGSVFQAKTSKNKLVAIKLIQAENDTTTPQCLLEEQMLARCRHPLIPSFIERFHNPQENLFATVREFIQGSTLRETLKTREINHSQLSVYFLQIIFILDYLHQRKIIHGDIKLDNMIILQNDSLVLIDFGLSQFHPSITHTQGSMKIRQGTPYYMAPECWGKNSCAGQAVDMWASGICLYYMLYKQQLFQQAKDLKELEISLQNFDYVHHPTGNEFLDHFLPELLKKDPAQRPATQDILRSRFIENIINSLEQTNPLKNFLIQLLNKQLSLAKK